MNKRPFSVLVISGLFLVAGLVGLAYHATEFSRQGVIHFDGILILAVRLLAVICGVFLCRGENWARWLGALWLAFHVGVSAFHTASELIIHSLLFAVIVYFLFRRSSSVYFRRGPSTTVTENGDLTTS